jgi:CRP-like cAMP-binding protein
LSEFTSILDDAAHWAVRYPKGMLIYDEGEPSRAIYRLDKGWVRLQVNGAGGDRQIVAFLLPGDLFGLCVDRRRSAAEAVTDVELTRYALQSVLELSARSPEVTVGLMKGAESLYGDLAHHVQQITHLSAPDRVLSFLNWLVARDPGCSTDIVQLPMSRRDIADYLGLTQETLSRVIRQLLANGEVEARGARTIVLTRPAGPLRQRRANVRKAARFAVRAERVVRTQDSPWS